MINITIIKKNQNIVSIELTGHSGYADAGQDIVCAAASSIAQTLILGLKNVVKAPIDAQIEEEIPRLFVSVLGLKNEEMQQAQVLMQTAVLGLKEVKNGYAKYIKIKEKNDVV